MRLSFLEEFACKEQLSRIHEHIKACLPEAFYNVLTDDGLLKFS